MTLPASPPIDWIAICNEFGLTPATAVWPTDFYGLGGAPSSGALSFSDFLGRSALSVQITDRNLPRFVSNSGSVTTSYRLLADGTARDILNTVLETWMLVGSTSDVQVRATLTSGDTPGGTLNTWLDFSTERAWSIGATAGEGTNSSNLLIELRSADSLQVLDSAAITISATSNTGPPGGG